jgi:AcrR family transcriptional regulator
MQEEQTTKKIDRRTQFTQSVIKEAFIQLLQKMPVEKISVTEICKIAEINRGTFYIHYQDPYDVLKQIENEYGNKIVNSIHQIWEDGRYHNDLALALLSPKIFASDDTLILLMTSNPRSSNLLQQIKEGLETVLIPNLMKQHGFSEEEAHVVIAFIFSGYYAVYMYLLNKNSSPEEVEKMIEVIDGVIRDGLG